MSALHTLGKEVASLQTGPSQGRGGSTSCLSTAICVPILRADNVYMIHSLLVLVLVLVLCQLAARRAVEPPYWYGIGICSSRFIG